jgi:hypothetical protein
MLSIELVKVVGDWLWHNGKIDSMPELGPGWLDGFVVEITKGKMASIGDEVEPIAWYDSPLWMMSAPKASWRLAPSSFLDSRNMGESFVQWLVSLPSYMQYGGLYVNGPLMQPWIHPGVPPR